MKRCVFGQRDFCLKYCSFTDTVRSMHGPETEISLVYNDLPTNDFESLTLSIHGQYDRNNYILTPGVTYRSVIELGHHGLSQS